MARARTVRSMQNILIGCGTFYSLSKHISSYLLDTGKSRAEEPEKVEKKEKGEKGDKKAKPAVAASLARKQVIGGGVISNWGN